MAPATAYAPKQPYQVEVIVTPAELSETYLLALAVYREARGEAFIGKVAVADVIVERAWDSQDRWPDTIEGVILEPKQFSAFNHDDPNVFKYPERSTEDDRRTWDECVSAATVALKSGARGWANHYHTKSITPSWHDPDKVVGTIGSHVFLKL